MDSDLISRSALLKAMDNVKELMEEAMCIPSWATAKECIKTVKPVDAVEVVRCKECKRAKADVFHENYWCFGKMVEKDHFCGYGEK